MCIKFLEIQYVPLFGEVGKKIHWKSDNHSALYEYDKSSALSSFRHIFSWSASLLSCNTIPGNSRELKPHFSLGLLGSKSWQGNVGVGRYLTVYPVSEVPVLFSLSFFPSYSPSLSFSFLSSTQELLSLFSSITPGLQHTIKSQFTEPLGGPNTMLTLYVHGHLISQQSQCCHFTDEEIELQGNVTGPRSSRW